MARKLRNKRMTLPQTHFHLEVWMSVPPAVRSGLKGWKMNLDTGAAVNTFTSNIGPEDSIGLPVVNGFLMVELGNSKDKTKTDLLRCLNGTLTGVHKVLCRAAEIACKGRQDFHNGHDGGHMILIHSKNVQGMRIHFEKLVNWHGKNELISCLSRKQHFRFLP